MIAAETPACSQLTLCAQAVNQNSAFAALSASNAAARAGRRPVEKLAPPQPATNQVTKPAASDLRACFKSEILTCDIAEANHKVDRENKAPADASHENLR